MAFAEVRHERAAQEGQSGHRPQHQHDQNDPDRFQMREHSLDRRTLEGLQLCQPGRLLVSIRRSQQQRAQCRSRRQGHQQRGDHRKDERQRQRAHEMSLDAGGEQFWQKDGDDHYGCVDDRSPHLERGFPNDFQPGSRSALLRILTQPPHDVLDPDDCIIDQHTQRDGKATECHRVQRQAHVLQDCNCSQQRQRYRGEGYERRTCVAQKQVEHREDEHGRDYQ